MDNTNASLSIAEGGHHTLDLWMREDGLRLDKVLLTTDPDYILSGQGPAEGAFSVILPATTISYDYDPLYRLAEAIYTGEITATYTYAYDAVGNMHAYTETVGTETTVVNRTFDDANQLQTTTDAAAGTTSFYYDGNGNLVQILPPGVNPGDAGEQLYTFNQRNLLTAYQLGEGGSLYNTIAEYVYDSESNRVQQVDYSGATSITTTYTNDNTGLSQVLVSDDGTTQTHNLLGLDLISQDDGTEARTLLVDGLGSVRTEMVGNDIETVTTYEPYGNLLARTGTSGTTYGFTGEQHDHTPGLVYLRARYYNPGLRIFQSKDPWPGDLLQPQTMHGWSYVENNPVNRIDPTGNQSTCAGRTCGPDITRWLFDEMKVHYHYGVQIRNLRELMRLQTNLVPPVAVVPLFSVATHTPFREIVSQFNYGVPKTNLQTSIPIGLHPVNVSNASQVIGALGVLEYALYGLAVDYSNVTYFNSATSTCGAGTCGRAVAGDNMAHPVVSLCGKCIDASDIGNMMFGLGGAARSYHLGTTWGSAGFYNVLADWLPSDNRNLSGFFTALTDPDGRGAIPGHLIGQTLAFLNEAAFCTVVNGTRWIGYNDGTTLEQVNQCTACSGETARPLTYGPSSLAKVSGIGLDPIPELKSRLGLK